MNLVLTLNSLEINIFPFKTNLIYKDYPKFMFYLHRVNQTIFLVKLELMIYFSDFKVQVVFTSSFKIHLCFKSFIFKVIMNYFMIQQRWN